MLQCVAVCCSALQCIETSSIFVGLFQNRCSVCRSVLQCVALRCSVLQCGAVCVALCSEALQCVAVCCSVLQYVAAYSRMAPTIVRSPLQKGFLCGKKTGLSYKRDVAM